VERDVTLSIHLAEDDTMTIATAILDLRGEHFEAIGRAKRNPDDPLRPVIGEELAVARALDDLEDLLMDAAWDKIAAFSGA
jgi:hypothetical protein